jgi:hypothetical protein
VIRAVLFVARFLIVLFVVRIALRTIAAALRPSEPRRDPASSRAGDAVPLLRDRICNTFFPAPRAVRATIGGEEQVFCSSECAQRARVLASS